MEWMAILYICYSLNKDHCHYVFGPVFEEEISCIQFLEAQSDEIIIGDCVLSIKITFKKAKDNKP